MPAGELPTSYSRLGDTAGRVAHALALFHFAHAIPGSLPVAHRFYVIIIIVYMCTYLNVLCMFIILPMYTYKF